MTKDFLNSAIKQFEYYKSLGEKTIDQLEEKDLFWQYNKASNSIAIIVQHLWGNMLSRWTDFLTSDGEKHWRKRDEEFELRLQTKEEVLNRWNEGWKVLFKALSEITEEQYQTKIYIRNQEHMLTEAINRQLCHYAHHVGQIVYIGRMCKGEDWQSLSIPKGKTNKFNADKMSKGKHTGHFTDDLM